MTSCTQQTVTNILNIKGKKEKNKNKYWLETFAGDEGRGEEKRGKTTTCKERK